MTAIISRNDLSSAMLDADLILIDQMLAGANGQAARVAPCLGWDGTETDKPAPNADQLAEAKLVLIGAVSRWMQAGAGAFSQTTEVKGPFTESQTIDTRQSATGYRLWPSEINQLQEICKKDDQDSGAFSIDTAPVAGCSPHADICSINFGANYCSCGAVLTNLMYPLYERCD